MVQGWQGCVSFAEIQAGFLEVGVISLSSLTGSLPLHCQAWRDRGADPWVVEVLQEGYRLPFLSVPPLSSEPIAMPSYSPNSIKGKALEEVTPSLVEKDAVELASLPSPGHYSLLFVVWKTSGSWRLVIDLSVLNCSVSKTPFKMETLASVLLSVHQGNWMVSLNLKEVYLQVPIHPDSRKFLRFVAFNRVHQFRALCFGLSTASQIFTRVMAPVSSILHSMGIRLRRYLDDWLIQASSREDVLHSLQTVLSLCLELGIFVSPGKSNFVPAQQVQYLVTVPDSVSFRASPSQQRVEKLLSIREEFLSSRLQPASSWQVLLGVLSSLSHLIPGGRFSMRSLQLTLHRCWDRANDSTLIVWDNRYLQDLSWWLDLDQVSPDLDFWSDASDLGWGAHLGREVVSSRWSPEDTSLSISAQELLAVEQSHSFSPSGHRLHGLHLCRQLHGGGLPSELGGGGGRGARSVFFNKIVQRIFHWVESQCKVLAPQIIMGQNNVLANALSRPNQIQGSKWTLKMEVFDELRRRWPVMVDLFVTSASRRCSLYFSPFCDP